MDKTFTRFIVYSDIDTRNIDLFADAFGYEYTSYEFLNLISGISYSPDDSVVSKLLKNIDRPG